MIVVVEGIDGCGKGTQVKAVREHFASRYALVEVMHFPVYDSPTGRVIQGMLKGLFEVQKTRNPVGGLSPSWISMPTSEYEKWCELTPQGLTLQSLMLANRFEQIGKLSLFVRSNEMMKGLSPGYRDLLILDRYTPSALAYGQADGLSGEWLKDVNAAFPEPAYAFLLDISVEESFRRRPKREDAYEASRERLAKARQNYLDYFQGAGRFVIDGTRPAEEIAQEIVRTIEGGK